jgi:uncharacterized repeat protein (TIGR01451 family)
MNSDNDLTLSDSDYPRNVQARANMNRGRKKSIWKILYTLWIILILLSQVPFVAEYYFESNTMDDSYEYSLTFTNDGKTGHYYIERYDTSQAAKINVIYTSKSNSLEVDCRNIKILKIYCREMYDDKSQEVFKQDPSVDSNYYKTYFITRNLFTVHVYTPKIITQLSFIDAPIPYNVTVNGQEWWLTNTNYSYNNDSLILTRVPPGHSYVDIYFKSNNKNAPVAKFTVSKTIAGKGEDIYFNASTSYDTDGKIENYIWDFGEGTYKSGKTVKHAFILEGDFNVLLTVRDDDHLLGRAEQQITVVKRVMSVTLTVDKPIATPGSVLTYTITPSITSTWMDGVKDIVITNVLPKNLKYVDANPLPGLKDNNLTWRLGTVLFNEKAPAITLQASITENVTNGTVISNQVTLDYKGLNDQEFPSEVSNIVDTQVNIKTILAPRIKTKINDIELKEDDLSYHLSLTKFEYDMQDYGIDLRWYITDKNESLYIIAGEYSDNDIIIITPLPDAFGASQVTLWLTDSEGYTAHQKLWINITPINDPPVFALAPDLIIHYDDPYTFYYDSYVNDIDTPKEDLLLFASERIGELDDQDTSEGDGLNTNNNDHIQVDGFKVTYNYPEDCVGKQIFITLVIYDGIDSDADTIQINITDDYTPKLLANLPDVILEEGETKNNLFDLDDYFDDPDGDSLFYSFGETHVLVVINENHSVDISSPTDWFGIDTVTFRAHDPIGAIAEDTISIIVTPINDPPIISGLPSAFIVHHDIDYSFDLRPYITDKDNDYEELNLILDDIHIRTDPVIPLKIIMNYPKAFVGMDIPVSIKISDGFASDTADFTVKVTQYWPPENRKFLPDISFKEDKALIHAFNLDNYFTDRDSNTLYYSYGQEFINITINANHSVDFRAPLNWNGVEIVTFRASDPTSAFVENVITVTVIPVNDPPKISVIPSQTINAKQFLRIDLTEFINDVDNNISELSITAVSEKFDIWMSGRKLVIYAEEPVVDVVKITVSDGQAEAYETILIVSQGKKSDSETSVGFLMSLLWALILIIITIISISGYVGYKRYYGDYKIEEVFWIYENGILISHITPKKTKRKADEEIVSGMLTAILDFSEDAFSEEDDIEGSCIKEIQMNEKNILVDRGRSTFLATVFIGKSGKVLYSKSSKALKIIEARYYNKLKRWTGDSEELIGGRMIISSILFSNESINITENDLEPDDLNQKTKDEQEPDNPDQNDNS